MNTAIGIVAAMVNVPQGLPRSALTTTSATTASRMIMIEQHGEQRGEAAEPADLLARHLPERLAVAPHRRRTGSRSPARAPPSTAPMMIQSVPGR